MSDPVVRLNTALEGRYAIERELGEGGMATVYLADDLKHERKVALKVLKPELAAVVGAERFLSEIKVTANLNHPHILPLHDSGEADGFLFYVMPYVEGESLRDRIDREKQLPVDEAVRIATAVANALDHAHRHKVIHRDIKPANILLQDGEPVVADFGIALAVGAAGSNRLTETGLSLGTPYYMSPEQATGDQPVGASTDTYALGSVLYEMLVGDPPYMGSTAQAVLGQIISAKPISATDKRPAIPANVDAALRKALEKLPADRFTSAQDFAKALADEHFRYGEEAAGVAGASRSPWNRLTMVFAALATVTTIGFGWAFLRPPPAGPITRVSVLLPEGQALHPDSGSFDLSSDGSLMVYRGLGDEGQAQLWLRRWDELDSTPIRGTDGAAIDLAVSPDGREVAALVGGSLQAFPLDGGLPRMLTDSARCCLRWSPDGAWVYYGNRALGVSRVASGGGSPEVVTRIDIEGGDVVHLFTDPLPGGRAALYTTNGVDERIQVVDLETGEVKDLISGNYPRYSPTGHLLFVEALGSTLLAAPFDLDRLELTGSAVLVAEGLFQNPSNRHQFYALSQTGTLLYSTGVTETEVADTELMWVTRSGEATPVDSGWQFNSGVLNPGWSLSPDGTRVALHIRTGRNDDIWTKQLPEGPLERLTFTPAPETHPWWTPDGQSVMYLSFSTAVWSKRIDGAGDALRVFGGGFPFREGLWSPDGEWLILRRAGDDTGGLAADRDLWALRPSAEEIPTPLVATEWAENSPALSRDGRWLAYSSNETGRHEVFVVSFPNVDSLRVRISTDGGRRPMWAHNGRELFFLDASNAMVAAQIETIQGFRVAEEEELFTIPPEYYTSVGDNFYDVSLDDQRFLMGRRLERDAQGGGAPNLILVQNFFEELKERVPN